MDKIELNKELGVKITGARVLLLEDKAKDKTDSGIYIPDNAKTPTFRGTVLAVGPGAMLDNGTVIPVAVKEGDRIIYTNWSGSPIIIDDETYVILNERDILCVIED